MHDVQQARAGHADQCSLRDLNVQFQLQGGVYVQCYRAVESLQTIDRGGRKAEAWRHCAGKTHILAAEGGP